MVGTNRSKGCKTCIRRKVRCGAEKPICLRCITSRIPCEGYVRDLRWIQDKPSSSGQRPRRKSRSASTASQSPLKGLTSPQTELYIEFFKHKFLNEYSDRGTYSHVELMTGCLNSRADDASNLAIHALMSLFFARMHGNSQSVLTQSNAYYGKALRKLQSSIESDTNSRSTITPAALALTYFEIVAYHTEGGWLHHAGGIGRLMELSGPHRYQEYPEHGYFLLARPLVLMSAMTLREPTFLAAMEWKTTPWEKHPETKTPSHEMMDLWADGPSIGRDIIMVATVPDTIEDVTRRLADMVRFIVRWRWKWEHANPHAIVEQAVDPSSSILTTESGRVLFQTVFWYENPTQMMEIMYYNVVLVTLTYCAACLSCPDLVEDVISTIPGSHNQETTNPLGFPQYGARQAYSSGDICRSIEYALRQGTGSIGALFLLLPLRMCVLTFALQDTDRDYRSWIATICDEIASDSGFALARRLKYLPQLHPTRNLKDEVEEGKHNITNTTLPMAPIDEYMKSANEIWDPISGGSFPATVGASTIDDRIQTRQKNLRPLTRPSKPDLSQQVLSLARDIHVRSHHLRS